MTIIKIDKPVKVSDIKKEFNSQFPYLKIEFFKKKHKELEGSFKKDLITNDFILKPTKDNDVIMYGEDTLVSELEKQFFETIDLSAQVFRKSGRAWIETTYTDNWSLKKQNQEGMELSNSQI